jgi:hypothetical protein
MKIQLKSLNDYQIDYDNLVSTISVIAGNIYCLSEPEIRPKKKPRRKSIELPIPCTRFIEKYGVIMLR